MPAPIVTMDRIGSTDLAMPLAVVLRHTDGNGRPIDDEEPYVHVVEGRGLFVREMAICLDMGQIATAIDDVALSTGIDPEDLRIVDLDFVDAPRITWTIDARWDEGEGEFHAVQVASCPIVAQVLCAMSMADCDENRPVEAMSGHEIFGHAILVSGHYDIGEPHPRLLADRRLVEIVTAISAEAGRGNAAVDDLASVRDGSHLGRRGPEGRDGDVLVTFSTSGSRWSATVSTILPKALFDRATRKGNWQRMEHDSLPDLLEQACRTAATEILEAGPALSREDWSERYRHLMATMSISDIGRIGDLRPFAIFGRNEGTVHERLLSAVDDVDAVLRGAVLMTEFDSPGRNALEELESTLKQWELSCEPLPFDYFEARSVLRRVAEDRSNLSSEASAMAEEFAFEAAAYDTVIGSLGDDYRPAFEGPSHPRP